jgi:hypothetical protein
VAVYPNRVRQTMRVALARALAVVVGIGAVAACDRRRIYQPPVDSYTAAALDVADSGAVTPSERSPRGRTGREPASRGA